MSKRRRSVLGVLALAVAAIFVLPASQASAVDTQNACRNSVTANNSQIGVDTSGTASPNPVAAGGTVTLSNLSQTANVPGAIFVAGYNLGLLVEGENTVPANVFTFIEGTNTVEGSQQTSIEGTSISTTINDPDNAPGTGDETATDGQFTVNYDDMSFTAGASGTIEFRQDTIYPLSPSPAGSETGSLIIRAVVGGFLNVRFACSPGTVAGPDPGVVTPIDPANTFATTTIGAAEPQRQISINDASATEGGMVSFTVSLDAASANPITVDFATADGSATAPGDYTAGTGTVTFAAGDTSETVTVQTVDDALVEGTETFNVNLSNATGNSAILDGTGVGTINDNDAPPAVIDAAVDVIVKGPVQDAKDGKTFVVKVTNLGDSPITIDPSSDIAAFVAVEGSTTGTVTPTKTGTKTIAPGHSTRFRLRWEGAVASGDEVEFTASVNLAGDSNPGNDSDSETRTAR